MKNSILGIIIIVLGILIGCILGLFFTEFILGEKQTPIVKEEVIEEKSTQETLILVHRDHEMKKGQFVYISGILNDYLIVKKLKAVDFPHPETPIYVVHSFHNHFYMYIKLISK